MVVLRRSYITYFLHDVDITKVDLRNPPRTLALIENQIATLRGVKRFWFSVLRSAKLPYFHAENDNYHVIRDVLYHYWLAWCRTVNHKNTITFESFGTQFKELIPALDVNGKVQKGRNGAVVSLVEGGRQSSGDREYFHKIPTLELCRQLWDNKYEAHHNWEGDEKPTENEVQKWEQIDVSDWIKRKRNIMDFNTDF
jgi:Poxvirus D5 protein-like